MIQAIGLMIGVYIITRALSFITRKDDRAESTLVVVFSVITVIITIFSLYALLSLGTSSLK